MTLTTWIAYMLNRDSQSKPRPQISRPIVNDNDTRFPPEWFGESIPPERVYRAARQTTWIDRYLPSIEYHSNGTLSLHKIQPNNIPVTLGDQQEHDSNCPSSTTSSTVSEEDSATTCCIPSRSNTLKKHVSNESCPRPQDFSTRRAYDKAYLRHTRSWNKNKQKEVEHLSRLAGKFELDGDLSLVESLTQTFIGVEAQDDFCSQDLFWGSMLKACMTTALPRNYKEPLMIEIQLANVARTYKNKRGRAEDMIPSFEHRLYETARPRYKLRQSYARGI